MSKEDGWGKGSLPICFRNLMEVVERWQENGDSSGIGGCSGHASLTQRTQQAGTMSGVRKAYLFQTQQV